MVNAPLKHLHVRSLVPHVEWLGALHSDRLVVYAGFR